MSAAADCTPYGSINGFVFADAVVHLPADVFGDLGILDESQVECVDGELRVEVTFDGEKTNLDAIHQAIADVGYDTKKVKAKDEVYDNLHGCCKYDRTDD